MQTLKNRAMLAYNPPTTKGLQPATWLASIGGEIGCKLSIIVKNTYSNRNI